MSRRPEQHHALRGAALAGCSATLAVSAHTLAEGSLPAPAPTVLSTVFIGWLAAVIARRMRGPLGTLAVLGIAQLATHGLLSALAMHSHHGSAARFDGPVMTATHAAATLVTALLLTRAETLLAAVAAGMRRLVPLVIRPAPVSTPTQTLAVTAGPALVPQLTVLLRRVHPRRGPPVCC